MSTPPPSVVSTSVLETLRRPRFRLLYLAWALSMVGDWFTYVAVGLLAIRGPQGIVGVALVQLAHSVPKAITAPLAGWLADRVDRRWLLCLASVARGLATLGMLYAALRDEIEWVEGLLFLRMGLSSFVLAPEAAAIPMLVERHELEPANRLIGTSWAILFTAGVALGGVVTGAFGPVVALAIDTATFFLAAALFAGLGPLRPTGGALREDNAISLGRDALQHPERLRAALAKVPTSLISGAAWVVMHSLVGAGASAAYGLGGLHATRGVGNGVGPWILRRFGPRGSVAGGVLATAVGAVLVSFDHLVLSVVGCLLWGLGLGATWVGASVWLQRVVPDVILGRYAALDVGAYGFSSGLGGLAAAGLLLALGPVPTIAIVVGVALLCLLLARPRRAASSIALVVLLSVSPALVAPAAAQPAVLAALERRAVSRDRFVQHELYTWTTAAQAAALRRDRVLLTAGPDAGAVRAPYQVALDALLREEGLSPSEGSPLLESHLARLLTEHPSYRRRRYAWPTPYGTVIPRGSRGYGPVLVRIRLDPEAYTVRFAPEETPRFSAVDGDGAPVPLAEVLAHPERIGAVLHERHHARLGAYREYVVQGGVASWSLETEAVRARVDEDLRLLGMLRRIRTDRSSMTDAWDRPGTSVASRFAATMPFDTLRHRPRPETIRALAEALRERRPRLRPFVVSESDRSSQEAPVTDRRGVRDEPPPNAERLR